VPHRSPARFLAPLAVVAVFSAVYLVVQTGLREDSSSATPTRTTAPAKQQKTASTRATYVVRTGDTLSAIAQRTGVSLDRLHQLNPSIDVNSLNAGQKLTLRKRQTS
jgi:LysM repeat protein